MNDFLRETSFIAPPDIWESENSGINKVNY